MAPLSESISAGTAQVAVARRKELTTSAALNVTRALEPHGKARVVVDPVEDFYLGAIREGPVGDVELPAFVGLVGLEAHIA